MRGNHFSIACKKVRHDGRGKRQKGIGISPSKLYQLAAARAIAHYRSAGDRLLLMLTSTP